MNLLRTPYSAMALLVAGLTFTQASLQPRYSRAFTAVASGGSLVPALVIIGASPLLGGAIGAGVAVLTSATCSPSGCRKNQAMASGLGTALVISLIGVIYGLVVLDESGAPTVDLQPLTPETARENGISEAGTRIFNRHLDRINSVSESIARGLSEIGITETDASLEYIHSGWAAAEAQGIISGEARAVLQILAEKTLQKASTQM
jgi:hypothetical protein